MKRYGLLSLVAFCLLMVVLLVGFQTTSSKLDEQDLQRVQESVQKAAHTCYSVEGFYPDSIDYLKENYHLQVDEQRYRIHYEWIGDNIQPDIYVFVKGAD